MSMANSQHFALKAKGGSDSFAVQRGYYEAMLVFTTYTPLYLETGYTAEGTLSPS